jgi:hypothetical protein
MKIDIIRIEELNKVLEHAKSRKIPVPVNLTMQLFNSYKSPT